MPAAPWSQPPPLPEPPLLEAWLFERPVTAAGALLGAGVVCFLVLRARGKSKGAVIGGGALIALAAAVALIGSVVETSRERVARLSAQVIARFQAADQAGLGVLLADDLVLDLGGGGVSAAGDSSDKALVLEAARAMQGQAVIDTSRVREPVAADGPRAARSQVFVRTGGGGFGPSLSWWMFSWRREPDGEWRVSLIELLLLNGERPRDLAPELRRTIR